MAFITKRGDLEEADVNSVLGYPIDTFQQGCLKVIVKPDVDLLAMAPTGSGKTAVALMAILQAFRRGKKAVYTSPIKALSNRYAEFKGWFEAQPAGGGHAAHRRHQDPSAAGLQCELIITLQILRNKVVKVAGVEPRPPPPPLSRRAPACGLSLPTSTSRTGLPVSGGPASTTSSAARCGRRR